METLQETLARQLAESGETLETLKEHTKPDRDSNGRFTKGNKGGGRKKLPKEFHSLLKEKAISALETVISIMENEESKPELRLKAAMFILENSYGAAMKLVQQTEAEEENLPFTW